MSRTAAEGELELTSRKYGVSRVVSACSPEGRKRGNLQVTTRKIKKCHEHRKERAHEQKMNGAVYCQTTAALTRVVDGGKGYILTQ